MIGEKHWRRKGLASEALKLSIGFAKQLEKKLMVAKINKGNEASIALFKKHGFVLVKEIKPFDQLEFHLELNK